MCLPLMWRMPSWEEDLGEFLRVEQELGIPLDKLRTYYEESVVLVLPPMTWDNMLNCDSSKMRYGDHARAFAAAQAAGRDLDRVMDAVISGGVLPMPIVVILDTGSYYLVAGNTRLMACRVEGRTPAVLILDSRPRPSTFRRRGP